MMAPMLTWKTCRLRESWRIASRFPDWIGFQKTPGEVDEADGPHQPSLRIDHGGSDAPPGGGRG